MLVSAAPREGPPRAPSLAALLAVPASCVLFFLLFIFLYLLPARGRILRESTLQQASTAAQLLAASLIGDQEALQPGQLPPDLLQRIEKVRRQGQVLRLRLYSSLGQVAYSSETAEIGTINRDPYFQEILIGRRVAAAEAGRGSPSLEGQHYPDAIVEAYVPIVRQGRLLGVLEIYYDAAAQSQGRRNLPNSSAVMLALGSAALLAAAGLSASGARLALRGRKAAPAGGEARRKSTRNS